jgi:hypothetical protein
MTATRWTGFLAAAPRLQVSAFGPPATDMTLQIRQSEVNNQNVRQT